MSVKGRPSLRAEQAARTRRRILGAAAGVFEERGFAATRIDDIAIEAGVAVATVYKVFTNKVNVLVGALSQAMAGDDTALIDQTTWFARQLDEPDPVEQLSLIAENACRLYQRAGRLLNVLQAATPLDPDLAQAWDDIAAQRLERSLRTARNLRAKARGRLRLSPDETAVTLLGLTEPALFTTYIAAGRTADQYQAWLSDVLCRSLLD